MKRKEKMETILQGVPDAQQGIALKKKTHCKLLAYNGF